MLHDSPAFSGFAVADLEATRIFYTEVLGLDVTVEDAQFGLLSLALGGGTTVLVYVKEDHVPASYTVLNFPVLDVEATVDQLRQRGVQFERYDGFDQDDRGIHRGDGPLIAWFTDPSGNVLSVMQQD